LDLALPALTLGILFAGYGSLRPAFPAGANRPGQKGQQSQEQYDFFNFHLLLVLILMPAM
jgi:hypothetical protein